MKRIKTKNKWELCLTDGKNKKYIAIPKTSERTDFIDRNFIYHYDYKGCISEGILITIKNSSPKIIIIEGGLNRTWRIYERFKKYSRFIKQ